MIHPRRLSLSVCLLAGLIACGDAIAPAPEDVQAFVHAEGLPHLRDIRQILALDDLQLFRVTYGEPQDCAAGCFYLGGMLLKLGPKLGWISLDASPLIFDAERSIYVHDTTVYTFFPMVASDTALYTQRLFDYLAASPRPIYDTYRAYVALHDATPELALFHVAGRVSVEGTPHIAWLVVTHHNAQCSRRILDLMAALQSSAYSNVQASARQLAATFPQRCE